MKYLILFLILFSLYNCSSTNCIDDKVDLIKIKKIECWLNLMPGGKPSFHYYGEIEITKVNPEDFKLEQITLYDVQNLLNISTPKMEFINEALIDNAKTYVYNFSNSDRIEVTEEMLKAEFIDAKLTFRINDKVVEIIRTDIQLLRTY